jgi:hypothetical protein
LRVIMFQWRCRDMIYTTERTPRELTVLF